MSKVIVTLWGCSACGKTAFANYLQSAANFKKIKTTTTRPKRTPSEDDYHFVSVPQFKKLDTFAGTHFAGNYYGTDLAQVKRLLKTSPKLIIILTWSGVVNYVREFKGTAVHVVPVELFCPADEIYRRLKTRSDAHITDAVIKSRLASYHAQETRAAKAPFKQWTLVNWPDVSKTVNLKNETDGLQQILARY